LIQIRFINRYPISDIYTAAMATQGKVVSHAPKNLEKFAMRVVRSKHSILNEARIQILDDACRSDVTSHLVRSTKGLPRHYAQTKRPDLTGEERPKDPAAPRVYLSTWGADALIDMSHQRLCRKASIYTMEWVYAVRNQLQSQFFENEEQTIMAEAVSLAMVPGCVAEYGCPEGERTCHWWGAVKDEHYHNMNTTARWLVHNDGVRP
jgi:hypothetical protein